MTPEDQPLTKRDFREALREALDSAVLSIADEFTGLRNEMNRRFDRVDQRFDAVERRLERLEYQTGGMSKPLTDAERLDSATAAALAAQQKAIDDLYAQLAALKRRLPPLSSQQ